jgi:ATP-dependent HslUV protease subunit HslV
LLVADRESVLMISGSGDLVEPDDGIIAIGSGGPFALAAARAMLRFTRKPARVIAKEALQIASEICVFSNSNIQVEVLR